MRKKNLRNPGDQPEHRKEQRKRLMNTVIELSNETGAKFACESLRVPRASFYRFVAQSKAPATKEAQRPTPPLALKEEERQKIVEILHCERFQDSAPHQIYATLLDEGRYHCSVRTMYRILEVTKTHSRPYVSNDNPFSEAQFKTLKYCPQFPGQFSCIENARSFCRHFFNGYNAQHRHSGIGLMTPEQVHYGMAKQIFKNRTEVLKMAFEQHPNRFKNKQPSPPMVPDEVWINKPKTKSEFERYYSEQGLSAPEFIDHGIEIAPCQDFQHGEDRGLPKSLIIRH
jgi:hypothetical protein